MDEHLVISCEQCGQETLARASYCHSCGQQIRARCSSCDNINVPGSRFCSNCGASLTPGPPGFAASATGDAEGQSQPAGVVCPRCYGSNEPGATYCFSCGLPLGGEDGAARREAASVPAFAIGAPGGFWVRLLAAIIDGIILMVITAVLLSLISGVTLAERWQSSGFGSTDVVSFGTDMLYYTIGVAVWATTVGKLLFGLYVVRVDGSKVGAGRALARYLAYFLSFLTIGIGFLMIALRQDKRGLHDLVCDTVVIRR